MMETIIEFGVIILRLVVGLMLLAVLFKTFDTTMGKAEMSGVDYITDVVVFMLVMHTFVKLL